MLKFSHLPLLSLILLILLTAVSSAGGHASSRHIHPRPHHRNRNRNATAMTPAALPPQQQNSTSSSASSASRQQQLNNIINALIGAGDFNNWANILSIAGPSYLPLSATFFIPADDSLVASPAENAFTDPLIFPYHIVPQRLTFAELLQFTTLSRLPTLLSSKSILVTNDSAANFTLDGSLLSHPDLFTSPAIVVHGISNLMDYSIYGDGALMHTNARDHPSPAQQQQQQQQQVLTSDGKIRHSGERHSKEYSQSWNFLIFWFWFLF
ncbi:FAS1 domain-containing protein SELMODRAFT_448915 [Linum grandiflorum]